MIEPGSIPAAAPRDVAATGGVSIVGRQLGKSFTTRGGEFRAIDQVSFAVNGGEFVSLIGPSGCGKSTLMLMCAGLLPPTQGEVLIDGRRLDRPLTDVGIVFQDHLLLDFRTALDNILLQAHIRRQPIRAARESALLLLEKLGIRQAADHYPKQLSGGMRQRVSIARALIHAPSTLLMDEPFGALDAITRTQIRHDLELLWMETRKTVLFITHSVDEAIGLSDRVLVMSPSPGRIGGREGRYLKAVTMVTQDRIFSPQNATAGTPPDTIGRSGGHDAGKNRLRTAYPIPYGAIVPEKLDGVLCCTRAVGTQPPVALNAHRGIVPTIVVGQAVGTAAALAIQENRQPRDVDLPALQQALRRDDVVLDVESVTYDWPLPEPGQEGTSGQIDRRE